ncbi:MAG: hypothetical protein BJ554DRAFT_1745 [Olpidium bornovanus]|uniref:Uncharacterized protein n=1 Tax=Olpidium bornovanus TaxID=278681 RepID=A0A8H7ZRY4_9FUNG|nr:MAG: hypothetical protein BJ554DRAFT_1745 [Olpidium bornovanus]
MVSGKITEVDHELMNQCVHLMNRADDAESLVSFMEYHLENFDRENRERAKSLVAYRSTKPKTYVNENGELVYKEERRKAASIKEYAEEMRAGSELTQRASSSGLLDSHVRELEVLLGNSRRVDADTKIGVSRIFGDMKQVLSAQGNGERLPFVYLKGRSENDPSRWEPDVRLTTAYLDALARIARDGLSFAGRQVLVTGCGEGSIGVELLKALLSGGAQVIATTSRFSKVATEFYRSIYERYGSKGSCLVIVPFNGGSVQDTKALVDYIYDAKDGLGWDLGYIIPFAAVPEQGREIDDIESWSELAHRVMLVNLLRLLGEVKCRKQVMQYDTRPAAVVLPMSSNHGVFGGDGLYGESKIGLETLINRFHSENWSNYLTIIGAVIGWTRGTGLMSGNNIIAEGIEELGARTFSAHEMAFNLVGLLSPEIVKLSEMKPIVADLNGGLHFLGDLHRISTELRAGLLETSEIRRAVAREAELDRRVLDGPVKQEGPVVTPRANMKFQYPPLKDRKPSPLRGMLDLEKVVVVTGFGEVGPFGGARTRWEMEAYGALSLEGCIEMAWMMGFIKFHSGPLKSLASYSGWIDTRTQEPVKDFDVKAKYEQQILKHTGIRMIGGSPVNVARISRARNKADAGPAGAEPELFNGYDPERKVGMLEVLVTSDMAPIEVCKEDAEALKRQHQEFVLVEQKDGQYTVRMLKGATLWAPKTLRFDRLVAGQIPTGWDARRYGVPEDIVNQVDPVTLYMLVSCVEALVNSGITDPYEFYEYCHVSEVGNTSGGGIGGMFHSRSCGDVTTADP